MNRPVRVRQTPVEIFNREVDRVVRGGADTGNNIPPEEARALKLARDLAAIDFSASSAIRQSLRARFTERSARYPSDITSPHRVLLFRQGHTLAGIGVAALMVLVFVVGLLSPQHVSATPVFTTAAASAALSDQPAVSLTVAVLHNQNFYPKPVPTPMAMSASTVQSTTSPEHTPVRVDQYLGNQFPIITTTISK
jgi:hypothetical protein